MGKWFRQLNSRFNISSFIMTIAAVIPQTSHYVGYYTNYSVDGDQLWWDRNEKGEDEVIFLF